jgi:hypothetical protein
MGGEARGAALQEEASHHLPPLRSKAVVVSREGKRLGGISGQATSRKRNASEPPLLMSKRGDEIKTAVC